MLSGNTNLGLLAKRAKAILHKEGFETNPIKQRIWGPNDPHSVTKIVVTTELNPDPEYIRAITNELEKLGRGVSSISIEKIHAKIGWVKALNPVKGKQLERIWHRQKSKNRSQLMLPRI